MTEAWRTAITRMSDGEMRVRGYDVLDLMAGRTFTDHIALLFKGSLPTVDERALLDAVLVAWRRLDPKRPRARPPGWPRRAIARRCPPPSAPAS